MDECRLQARKHVIHSQNKNTKYLLQIRGIWENYNEWEGVEKSSDGKEFQRE